MTNNLPRFMVAATSSGSGKTSWTLGLLRALGRKGLHVQAFKTGPDYIDPALHSLLTPRPSRNLDTRLVRPQRLRELFFAQAAQADISLIEGVMGYFDGAGNGSGSSAQLARLLEIPVILILDVRSSGESAAAMALGFMRYRRPTRIVGFFLNRVGSDRHFESVKLAVERVAKLPVLGSLPKDPELTLPERYLGLLSGPENPRFFCIVDKLADLIENRVDLDRLLDLARAASPLSLPPPRPAPPAGKVRIAVARDEAFRFYYEDNLDLLRRNGAELVFFSPLEDSKLPSFCSGLYLGGGYPELYAEKLAANHTLLRDIQDQAQQGLPIFAECGGYMYLTESIETADGKSHPMVGFLEGYTTMGRKRSALGYYEGTVQKPNPYCRVDTTLHGHCFHWSTINRTGENAALILKKDGGLPMPDGMIRNNVFASYLHIHFASHPGFVKNFVRTCHSHAKKSGGTNEPSK